MCVSGDAALDAAQHFCQRWTNHVRDTEVEVAPGIQAASLAVSPSRDYREHSPADGAGCVPVNYINIRLEPQLSSHKV